MTRVGNRSGDRVLVVAGAPGGRARMVGILETEGWPVDAVADAQAARPLLATGRYGLLLLDVGSGDEAGEALVGELDGRVPSLVVCDQPDGLGDGADGRLTRPFALDTLVERVRAATAPARLNLALEQARSTLTRSLDELDGLTRRAREGSGVRTSAVVDLELRNLLRLAQDVRRALTTDGATSRPGATLAGRLQDLQDAAAALRRDAEADGA